MERNQNNHLPIVQFFDAYVSQLDSWDGVSMRFVIPKIQFQTVFTWHIRRHITKKYDAWIWKMQDKFRELGIIGSNGFFIHICVSITIREYPKDYLFVLGDLCLHVVGIFIV